MNNIQMNEQWKLSGNCDICRRGKYCSTPCKRNKQRVNREVHVAVANAIQRLWFGKEK